MTFEETKEILNEVDGTPKLMAAIESAKKAIDMVGTLLNAIETYEDSILELLNRANVDANQKVKILKTVLTEARITQGGDINA